MTSTFDPTASTRGSTSGSTFDPTSEATRESTFDPASTSSTEPATPSTSPRGRKRRSAATPVDISRIAKREALPLTLRELCQLYTAKNANERDMQMHLRKWLDDFGLAERSAWSITTEELLNGSNAMSEMGYAQATANRDLSTFGTLYRFAHDQKLCAADFVSPSLAIRRKSCGVRFVAPAKQGEWDVMRRAARMGGDPQFTAFVWLIMDTGARRSEVTERKWDEFNLDAPEGPHIVLRGEHTKTGEARRIYFSHETAALLRRLRPSERYRHELAFKGRLGAPRKFQEAWQRYRERVGRPTLRVHDLRHMIAAELLKAGKGMSQVASLLGHSTLVLHTRYGHLDDAGVRGIQSERLGLDNVAVEFAPVAEARRREAERAAAAPSAAADEVRRLSLVAQEAMAAAMAAAQALAAMNGTRADLAALAGVHQKLAGVQAFAGVQALAGAALPNASADEGGDA